MDFRGTILHEYKYYTENTKNPKSLEDWLLDKLIGIMAKN